MRRLVISLLGTFAVELDGEPVTEFGYDKVRALLAYLAIEGRYPQRRDTLVGLLWPEQSQSEALSDLRTALSRLRGALRDRDASTPFLAVTRDSLHLNPDAEVEVDAVRFAAFALESQRHRHEPGRECPGCVRVMTEATALYRGDLLPGFAPDSAAFEDWLRMQRETLHEQALDLFERLAAYEEAQGAYDQVLAHARRQIQLEPWHEPAHRHAMRALAFSGQRAAAVAQFEACREVLDRELGVEPEPATLALREQILSGELLRPPKGPDLAPERERHHAGHCPYRGLAAFREADAALFFGRDTFVDRLFHAVTGLPRATVLIGPSGAGKSSVLFAGLLPRLREQGGWLVTSLRPGRTPFQALAGAIVPLLADDGGGANRVELARTWAAALESGKVSLKDLVARYRERQGDHVRVFLLVDQLEELYTLGPDPRIHSRFVDTLLDATGTAHGPVADPSSLSLLLALRADFVGQALAHRPFVDALQTGAQILGPMTREELREAIEKPAAARGAVFETGLVARILDDVAAAPGSLPLLEFALTLLWQRLSRGWLTHAAYEAIGQVHGSLARYAQQTYEALPESDRSRCRRVFTQLVQPGEATEDTRRVAHRTEVGNDAWPLVQHLANQRLVVTALDEAAGSETVEVAHEALIRHWAQLQGWMVEDRAFRVWQEQLRQSLATWERTGRDEGALLRGAPLAEAEGWLQTYGQAVGQAERAYIDAGIALRTAQRQAELDAAQRLQEAHDIALHQAAIGLAAEARSLMQGPDQDLAVLLALEAVERFPTTWQAELALAEIVRDFRLVWQCARNIATEPPYVSPDGTRLLLAWNEGPNEVWDLHSGASMLNIQGYSGMDRLWQGALWSPEGDRILAWSSGGRPQIRNSATGELLIELEYGRGPMWFPDGNRVLTSEGHGAEPAQIWDAHTGHELLAVPGDPLSRVSPDGRRIALATGQIWDAENGEMLCSLAGYEAYALHNDRHRLFWSPDGGRIGTGIAGSARVWDALTGAVILTLPTGYEGTADLSWSPCGNLLLTTGLRGERSPAILWNAETGERLRELPFHDALYWPADSWSPQGDCVALPDVEGYISVWEAATGRRLLHLAAHHSRAYAQWLPDGFGLASSGEDGLVRIWRTSTADFEKPCELEASMRTREGVFTTPIWSPDGTRVGRNWFDGTVRIWDIATGAQVLQLEIVDATGLGANWMDWAPQGERIVTGAIGGNVDIHDASTGERHLPLHEHDRIVPTVAWSPDGRRVLSVSMDGTATIWDALTGEELKVFAKQDYYWGAWSPDGQRIALCDLMSRGGPVRIWDVATGEALLTLLPDEFGYGTSAIAWSPDGARIVALSTDRVGRLWEARTGELIGTFPINSDAKALDWSPSSSRFLHTDNAGIHVWNAVTLREVIHFPLAEGHGCARWSPDGTAIAIAHRDGDLKVYPAWQSLEELIAYAKAHCVLRELTPEERARYGLASPEP